MGSVTTMSGNKKLSKDQSGLVSFIVVIIIMFVLSLIVLAFARLVRREQTQTLDRQLNSQAFYAAESGVNDALNALASASPPTGYNNNCSGPNSFIQTAGLNNDLGNGVSYSCLLVDNSPSQLDFDNVDTATSTVTPIRAPGNTPITSVEISWDAAGGPTGTTSLAPCQAQGLFPQTWPPNCPIGILRIELLPFSAPTSRNTLITSRGIAFLQPGNSGSAPTMTLGSIAGDNQGRPYRVNCAGTTPQRRCVVTITGTDLTGYLRIRSVYSSNAVTIRARTAAGATDLIGAQAEIDVTGRVSGVLKRIKVNAPIPVSTDNPLPEFALQSTKTQCKRFTWRPGVVTPAPPSGFTDTDSVCDPRN
jgi:Tfp pilus assembly protein PilV